jgi:hypothetical protein
MTTDLHQAVLGLLMVQVIALPQIGRCLPSYGTPSYPVAQVHDSVIA